jgi:hypothetical protein
MTQPVGSFRSEWFPDLVGPPPPPTLPGAPPPSGEPSGPPDPSTATTSEMVRLVPVNVAAASDSKASPSIVAARIDAFLLRAMPTFRTDEGWANVAISFRMTMFSQPDTHGTERNAAIQRAGLVRSVSDLLVTGRATPEVVASVTQSLIDMGRLPAAAMDGSKAVPDRIRQLMFDFHIGIDCASYVAQASLLARGLTRAQAGFVEVKDEDLSNLAAKGFTRISRVESLRPGDVFVLEPEQAGLVGHRAVVRAQRPASSTEIESIRATWLLPASAAHSDRWSMVVVDSSWGSFGVPSFGGVERRTWWHEATSDVWAWVDRGSSVVTAGPYGHTHWAIYTPKEAQ